jgi:hypothetical protein
MPGVFQGGYFPGCVRAGGAASAGRTVSPQKSNRVVQKELPQRQARGGYVAEKPRDNPPQNPDAPANKPADRQDQDSQMVPGSTSPGQFTLGEVRADKDFRIVTADGLTLTAQQATRVPVDGRAIVVTGKDRATVIFPGGSYATLPPNGKFQLSSAKRYADFSDRINGCNLNSDNCKDPHLFKEMWKDMEDETKRVLSENAEQDAKVKLDPLHRLKECISKTGNDNPAYNCWADSRGEGGDWFDRMVERLFNTEGASALRAQQELRKGVERQNEFDRPIEGTAGHVWPR